MIRYSVTIHIDKKIEVEWLEWMENVHIPDVLQTGLFNDCTILKSIENTDSTRTTYHFVYSSINNENLNTYLNTYAPALRDEHTTRFQGYFSASRDISEVQSIQSA